MYIPALNGLRAVAIILVLMSHLPDTPYFPELVRPLIHYFGLGTIGVRLFFLLSGYLITHVLLTEFAKTGTVSKTNFFLRRLVRIFPSFYFYLLILFVLAYSGVLRIENEAIFFSLFYVQNFNVFQNSEAFTSSWLVKHSWSLSVEEQFYLIYPFVFFPFLRMVKRNFISISVLAILTCTFFRALNYSYPDISRFLAGPFFMHADFLLLGCIMRIVLPANEERLKKLVYPYRNVLLMAAMITVLFCSAFEYRSGYNIMLCGLGILIGDAYLLCYFLLFPFGKLGLILEYRAIAFVGKLSYSLYVWQQLFLGSTDLWLRWDFLTYFPINLLLIFGCSVFSYFLIEKPFLNLKKRFEIAKS